MSLTLSFLMTGLLAVAFPRYNSGCQTCHGAFTGPLSPKDTVFPSDSKHEMHRGAQHMNTDCDLCHTTGDDHNPFLGSSNGTDNNPGVGCTGCHGRDYGGTIGNSGVGLRAHHAAAGWGDVCYACHTDYPAPLPEWVLPVYYGTADTNADDSCNTLPGFRENWSIGDTEGLDNDGDMLYDADDPDCACGVEGTCGDGTLDPVCEECDDGGESATCDADCTVAECGDGTVNESAGEECDDGNNDFGDACSPKCMDQNPPPNFLVDQLSIGRFRQTMIDLSTIPSSPGSTTPSRHWAQTGNFVAVAYIKTKLESYGYTNVTLDPYLYDGQTRNNIYATKMGTVQPTQMYIVSGHMDSMNLGDFTNAPGFDDDGSGTALVLELARVFAKARTDISVRFILWNNEETGLDGSTAYATDHLALQGTLTEPTWLGVIQHDMILFDRFPVPDADVEYQATYDFGGRAIALANLVCEAMARYGSMPCEVGDNMDFTDSVPFQELTAAISVRENQRVAEIGDGSNPHWHEPTDRLDTFTQADIQFGFNIVKMSAGAVAELVNAEPDCNMNDVGDADDIAAGAADTNADGVPDVCQDCNGNGTLDPAEIAGGTAPDCNSNGVPDECEIAAGNADANGDGIPDECQMPATPSLPLAAEHQAPKHRYLSIDSSTNGATAVAFRMDLVSMNRCSDMPGRACTVNDDCDAAVEGSGSCVQHEDVGTAGPWWVQPPQQEPAGCLPGNLCGDDDWFARLGDTPHYDTWTLATLHVGDCEVLPVATYEIRACLAPNGIVCGDPLTIGTIGQPLISPGFRGNYGDAVGPVDAITEQFTAPDGFTNVVDISAYILTKQNYGTANKPQTHPTWVDLHGLGDGNPPQPPPPNGNPPNYIINVSDLGQIKKAFAGDTWTEDPGNMTPGQCP